MSDPYMPESERYAYETVRQMGLEAAQQEVDAINAQAEAIMRDLCGDDLVELPDGFTSLNYMTDDQLNRRHLLTIGITLNEPNPALQARQRILARREQQRLERAHKRRQRALAA